MMHALPDTFYASSSQSPAAYLRPIQNTAPVVFIQERMHVFCATYPEAKRRVYTRLAFVAFLTQLTILATQNSGQMMVETQ
jgi:hypothetical protein